LPVGVQQRLEIVKALAMGPTILILDEPTAVLSAKEIFDLFRVLRRLAAQGRTVILIAHKLSEVLAIASRISVLRQGRLIATVGRAEAELGQLVTWMVGDLDLDSDSRSLEFGPVMLKVRELSVKGDRGNTAVNNVSFEVRSGEIFGIGGVDGNGQVELAEALVDIRLMTSGTKDLHAPKGGHMAYIPQDRQRDGLCLEFTIIENLELGRAAQSRELLIPWAARKLEAEQLVAAFDIHPRDPHALVRNLSGGNQQKVVAARELATSPSLLVAVNPTRGLDLKATQDVHRNLQRQARDGVPIVLISTDFDELKELANEIWVLSAGRLHPATQEALSGAS
jgi:simple sugar transport system ATP-binding protein